MKVTSSPSTADKAVTAEVKNTGCEIAAPDDAKIVEESTSNVAYCTKDDDACATKNKTICFSFSSLKTDTFDAKAVTGKIVIHVPEEGDNYGDVADGRANATITTVTLNGNQEPSLTGTLTFGGEDVAIDGKLTCQEGETAAKKWIMHLGLKWSAEEKKFVPTNDAADGDQGIMGDDSFLDFINRNNKTVSGDDDQNKGWYELQFFSKENPEDAEVMKPILSLSLKPTNDAADEGKLPYQSCRSCLISWIGSQIRFLLILFLVLNRQRQDRGGHCRQGRRRGNHRRGRQSFSSQKGQGR